MRIPKNILTKRATKPDVYLCETDKSRICKLETTNLQGNFKFNAYSELSFDVHRLYNNITNGETKVNPYYNKIEAVRLIYLSGFGYFELQGPELISDGVEERKSCVAYSLEYTLSQKFLENFYINKGTVDSIEVINARDEKNIVPITLYNPSNPKLSLLHLILEKAYGWKIGHVDKQLQTLSRQFEIDRESIYDFLMNEVREKFNCYIVFNTINNTINVYAESPTAKFIGNGSQSTFMIGDASLNIAPFSNVETVSIDGYKTTRWEYGISDGVGILTLYDVPSSGAMIEVVGVDSTWETDVFISFDNLAQEVNVSYEADNIKTVLTVTYGDDYDIRETNLGLPYLTDLSYYYTVDWLGQDLFDAYTKYLEKSNKYQSEYTNNSKEILRINDHILYEKNRLSLEYSLALSVNSQTVGTYYIRKQNADGSYYYSSVSLPSEYQTGVEYYSNATTNLQDGSDGNVTALYSALKKYFYYYYNSQIEKIDEAIEEIKSLKDRFAFMDDTSTLYLAEGLAYPNSIEEKEAIVNKFLDEMWNQVGKTPLEMMYLATYKEIQATNNDAGWSNRNNINYGYYYTVVLFVNSINVAIAKRDIIINDYKKQYDVFQDRNMKISNELIMSNNFTEGQLIRLSAFLREDELHLDDIVETSLDDLSSSFKIKQDAMESGRIELKRICAPQLQFSMEMANIYALPEFEPIINQFQLGNIIRVGIRQDYIKQSRLLEVNINFEDFSDFSCEFGELTTLRTQSDIHADLLSQAISAGKSVATNSSYWTRGSDQATATDLKIQQGLLDATTQIKSIDGTQGIVIDKYGILLQKINEDGSIDPHQTRLVNNMILMTDDNWQSSRSGLGLFTIDNQEMYSLVADAVLSGYIEGSRIVGGTIKIGLQDDGNYAFEVHEDGSVTMGGGSSISGYAKEEYVNQKLQDLNTTIISNEQPDEAVNGQLWLNTSIDPYELKVFTNGEWAYFSQQEGCRIFTSEPVDYEPGDLWILPDGSILKADDDLNWVDATPTITDIVNNVQQYFEFNTDTGLRIGQRDEKFYVNVSSTRMSFYDKSEIAATDTIDARDDRDPDEVVYISNKSAVMKQLIVEGDATFESPVSFENQISLYNKDNTGGVVWQMEQNGSFSLAIIS